MRLRPVHGDGRATGEHHHHRLAGAVQGLQQGALRRGQPQVGTVATGKARVVDRHLFAFDIAGEATDEHHHIGIACCIQRFVERRLGAGHAPPRRTPASRWSS